MALLLAGMLPGVYFVIVPVLGEAQADIVLLGPRLDAKLLESMIDLGAQREAAADFVVRNGRSGLEVPRAVGSQLAHRVGRRGVCHIGR